MVPEAREQPQVFHFGRRRKLHAAVIFALPEDLVRSSEGTTVVDFDRELDVDAGAQVVAQPGVHLAATCQDEHHGPVRSAERSFEGLIIGPARLGRTAGMRVQPKACELFGPPARVDLLVEEIRHRSIVEFDVSGRAGLDDESDIFDQ